MVFIQIFSLSSLLITNNVKVTSSSKMEPLAAKTLLVNLATEHKLVMDSVTTDRSSDLRTVMRWVRGWKIITHVKGGLAQHQTFKCMICVNISLTLSYIWCRGHSFKISFLYFLFSTEFNLGHDLYERHDPGHRACAWPSSLICFSLNKIQNPSSSFQTLLLPT